MRNYIHCHLKQEEKLDERGVNCEGWLLAEQELIKDEERFLPEKGRVLHLGLV